MSIELMNWVWSETKTKGSTRLVLLALADQSNDEGYCWPSINTIAKRANLSRRFVINILSELEKMGLLIKTKRFDDKGEYTSNMYKLVVNHTSLPSEPERTTGSEAEFTRVVNQGSLKPSLNHQFKPSLNDAQKYFLDVHGGKRLNKIQLKTIDEMVEKYGIDKFKAATNWTAKQGMTMGHALLSLETALPKWGQPKTAAKVTANDDGSYYG